MTAKQKPQFDNKQNYAEAGFNIAFYRKQVGLTQEELADLVGISRQHMGAIEAPNVHRPFSLDLLFNIAAVLKIPHSKRGAARPRVCPAFGWKSLHADA